MEMDGDSHDNYITSVRYGLGGAVQKMALRRQLGAEIDRAFLGLW
jgi:hypothetical protein